MGRCLAQFQGSWLGVMPNFTMINLNNYQNITFMRTGTTPTGEITAIAVLIINRVILSTGNRVDVKISLGILRPIK